MSSMYVCDICKLSINVAILHCNLCLKEYHSYCAYPMSNFPDKFPNQTYVCPNCIHNNNSSFHYFVTRAAYFMSDGSQDFMKEQYKKGRALSSYKKNINQILNLFMTQYLLDFTHTRGNASEI